MFPNLPETRPDLLPHFDCDCSCLESKSHEVFEFGRSPIDLRREPIEMPIKGVLFSASQNRAFNYVSNLVDTAMNFSFFVCTEFD